MEHGSSLKQLHSRDVILDHAFVVNVQLQKKKLTATGTNKSKGLFKKEGC